MTITCDEGMRLMKMSTFALTMLPAVGSGRFDG